VTFGLECGWILGPYLRGIGCATLQA